MTSKKRYKCEASLPVRGAWIEILLVREQSEQHVRRSPCGERGLKSFWKQLLPPTTDVAPRAGSVD